ncbi:SbtR family transcriptional regulator [Streptomyces sp. NPDC002784]
MVELAHQQGTLRPDITARDITYLQVALVGIMDATADDPDAYRRHLALFLDGARLGLAALPSS